MECAMKYAMLFAAAFALAAMASAPAAAETRERFATRVSYADLNLGSRAGADAMLNRIEWAAREGCEARSGRMSLGDLAFQRACVRGSMDRAVTYLGNPLVTARYIERGGRTGTITIS
jgi:UrcA family protein